MTSTLNRRRIAAAPHPCGAATSDYCTPIAKGDVYLEVTTFTFGHAPARVKQCVYCADLDGYSYLLVPIPPTQDYRYWDLDAQALNKDWSTVWGAA